MVTVPVLILALVLRGTQDTNVNCLSVTVRIVAIHQFAQVVEFVHHQKTVLAHLDILVRIVNSPFVMERIVVMQVFVVVTVIALLQILATAKQVIQELIAR
jgi:hypothetical protein